MYDMEYFELYLNSTNAMSGASTPHSCVFNIGSINDFVPNAYIYQNAHCCYVKVKYFSVEETTANFKTANIGTILIEMNGALPNSVKSNNISTSNSSNMVQSNIIGIIPTSSSDNVYSTVAYDNSYIKSNNILNGNIQINLKDQDGDFITLTGSKPYVMMLCVAFEKNNNLEYNNNNISY